MRTIKWPPIPIPKVGEPYRVFYSWGRVEWHVRRRDKSVVRVRHGWAVRKRRKLRGKHWRRTLDGV